MAQFGIIALDTVGLTLVGHGDMNARRVAQRRVGREIVAEIQHRLRCGIHQRLSDVRAAFPHHAPTDDTAGETLHHRHQVDLVFL